MTQQLPGIADIVAEQLAAVRKAVTAVENGVGQDDWLEGWEEAFWAAGGLVDVADDLKEACRREMLKREAEEEEA